MAKQLQARLAVNELGPLVVRQASPRQFAAALVIESDCWHGKVSRDQYIERKTMLMTLAHARGVTPWVLVPESDPEGLDIRASCSVWPAPVLHCAPGDTKTVTRPALGLFSLVVAERHRACGYGHLIIFLLYDQLAVQDLRWTNPSNRLNELEPLLLFGFSDIGSDFYSAFANLVSPLETTWRVNELLEAPSGLPPTRPLTVAEFPAVAAADLALLKQELPRLATTSHRFLLVPRSDTYAIRAAVSEFDVTAQGLPPLQVWGAEIGRPEDGSDGYTFAIWVTHRDPKTLLVLRLRAPSRPHLLGLLAAAQAEARRLAMTRIQIWNVDPSLLAATDMTTPRADELPELHWLGKNEGGARVEWLVNEAFADTPQ